MEPTAQFDEIDIPLAETIHGCETVKGVLGTPDWWPNGDRVAVVIAHSATSNYSDPLVTTLATNLAEHGYLTLRFNFPFAEAGKKGGSGAIPNLDRCFKAALNVLGRDPLAIPARLVLGGVGLGARVAAGLVADRLAADGLFLLGFPLHPQDKPDESEPEVLHYATSPMLFVQGTRDRRCDGEALRRALRRVGAPIELHDVPLADASFRVPKKTGRSIEDVNAEISGVVAAWIARRLT